MDEVWKRDEPDSPCVSICLLHPESRLCIGCRRTADEISRWSRMAPVERQNIIAALPDRDPGLNRRSGGTRVRRAERIAARRKDQSAG